MPVRADPQRAMNPWADRPFRWIELGVLSQDRTLERLQRASRLETKLLAKRPARLLVRLECLRLPARAIKGEHELCTKTLAQRMLANEGFEFGNELRVATEREVGLDPRLERS